MQGKWKILVVFICFCRLSKAGYFQTSTQTKAKPVNKNLTAALHTIMTEIFFKLFTTVNIVTAVQNPKDPYFLDFKDEFFKLNSGTEIYRLDNHTHIKTIRFRLKIYNAILLDTYKTFEEFDRNLDARYFNFRGYYLFVLIYGKIPEIDKIFAKLWEKNIVNVNVMFEEDNEVKLMTFTPFKRNQCRNTVPVYWATYKGNRIFNISIAQIFSDELKDFNECEVKMAAFERCPSACIEEFNNGSIHIDGFDIQIVGAIEKALNFKLKIDILNGTEQWGNVNGHLTTGAINKIVNNKCDFTAGNFLLRSSRTAIMDPSVVYLTFPVVFAIPLGVRLTSFEKLLRPFELVVWIFMLIFISCGLLVICIVNWKSKNVQNFVYGTGIKHPVVNMTIAVFGGTQVKLPRRNFARFILMMFLLFCLVQRNVYQGILYIF